MICDWDTAKFLIFSHNGIPLIYYSHFTSIAIFIGLFFITFLNIQSWPKNAFRIMCSSYVIWLFCDLVLWGNEKIPHILFFWTIINLVEPLIFVAAYAHFVAFTEQRTFTNKEKFLIILLLLPTLIMAPIGLSVVGFDLSDCSRNAVEGIAAYYNYFLEAVFITLILIHSIKRYLIVKLDKKRVSRLILATISLMGLLISFLLANFLGTYLDNYNISQLGHIAVPLFAAFLSYITIKFETFEPRIMITDIFTGVLILLLFSLFFIRNESTQTYVITLTFILSLPVAYTLITGIRKEVFTRKHIEKLATDLQIANDGQSNLIHIMNHQIKGYLSKSRNIFAELSSDPDYGVTDPTAMHMIKEGFDSLTEGVGFVQQVLNGSSAESGQLQYVWADIDLKNVVEDVANKQKQNAELKGLKFDMEIEEGEYKTKADNIQIRECIRNLIDNSILYTQTGGLDINLKHKEDKALLTIKDTGVGINKDDMSKLFTKGGRGKDSLKININSTGYGLAFVKAVAEAHKGSVWVESEGEGKGSTFFLEIPIVG